MPEYKPDSPREIVEKIKGKTIKSISIVHGNDDELGFRFADGSMFLLRYDWIYEWEYKEASA